MTLDERPTVPAVQYVPWEGPHRILDACRALHVQTVKPASASERNCWRGRSAAIEKLCELQVAGLTRVMGQQLLHRDLDAVALMGREIAPALRG